MTLNELILGPTGGMMALSWALGAGCGWSFSQRVIVKICQDQITALKTEMTQQEAKCAVDIAECRQYYEKRISALEIRLNAVEDNRLEIAMGKSP